MTEDLEIHIIEIPKAKRIIEKEKRNKIAQWMIFLDNPNSEEVLEIMKENENIKNAMEELEEMSEDEELRRVAELKEKYEMEERNFKLGVLEEAEEIKREGIKNEKIKIARAMINKNMLLNDIIEITGLTKEEIEKIKTE